MLCRCPREAQLMDDPVSGMLLGFRRPVFRRQVDPYHRAGRVMGFGKTFVRKLPGLQRGAVSGWGWLLRWGRHGAAVVVGAALNKCRQEALTG
jgi:hypothetical protein